MATKELLLDGLNCPNCSAKIEQEVNHINGVRATMNFATNTLTVQVSPEVESEGVVRQVENIVRKHEPTVVIKDKSKQDDKKTETREKGPQQEMVRLLAGGAVFALGLVGSLSSEIELILFLLSYAIVGYEVVFSAVKGVVRGQVFSEHFLMTIATVGAFLVEEYPEGVAVMLFYLVGEMLQDKAVERSRRSIGNLMNIRPDYANLKVGNTLRRVSPEEVKIGDFIVVKPGEKIPLDGQVVAGVSWVDTAALTGESVPRKLAPGSQALSGSINESGVLTIQVSKNYGESTVAKILELVQNASNRKAPTEKFITKFARYYTPAVVLSALAIAVIPPLADAGNSFTEWVYRSLIFLVVSCPCALVVSIPLGFFAGIGGASRQGILVKGSNYLEALNSVETVIMDKTGTLTKGTFAVTKINPYDGYSKTALLRYAAYAESYSNHPIALSIRKAYGDEVDKTLVEECEEIAGFGIRAKVDEHEVLVGNSRLLERENVGFEKITATGTVIYVAVDGKYAGCLVISDAVKEDAADAVLKLKALGVKRTVMLTGDEKSAADIVGKTLGVDQVYAELLPADKVEKLEQMARQRSTNGKVAFVGDGINDAPVLARADVGIAMGGLGSDAAIEAADIVIMTDEPSKVVTAIRIARRTRRIVSQNIIFALGVKAIFLLFGAFGIATMWEAVFADVGVTVIAVLNAMRALNVHDL